MSDEARPSAPTFTQRHGTLISVASTILVCYLSALLAVNLSFNPRTSGIIAKVFPHAGGSAVINQSSIDEAWRTIQGQYFLRDVPADLGTAGSERGMVDAIKAKYNDRFSAFLTKDQYSMLQGDLSGQHNGVIGLSLEARCAGEKLCAPGQNPTEAVVWNVLHGQPAEKAGLRNGDVLVAIANAQANTLGKTPEEIISKAGPLIRGPAGTTVKITVSRGIQTVVATATRADLQIPSVFAQKMGPTLYLQVTGFNTDTGDVARRLLQQNLAGETSIILDLRNDGGGYVDAAQKLASEFLTPGPKEKDVVVRRGRMDQGGNPNSAQNVAHDDIKSGGVAASPRMVVLVDASTASASEIVTAALHDYGRATVVGVKTFGKGSVQLDFPLPDGNDLHLTIEKWYGPNGETIDGQGVTPDASVDLGAPDARFTLEAQSADASADPQLQKALQIARG
ncbi:MAG: S41 family peptidase [Candidatus Dormibacteria bacterium]